MARTTPVSGAAIVTPLSDVPPRVALVARSRAPFSSASATASSACASSSARRLPAPSLTSCSARCTLRAAASRRAAVVSAACCASMTASRSDDWSGTSRKRGCPCCTTVPAAGSVPLGSSLPATGAVIEMAAPDGGMISPPTVLVRVTGLCSTGAVTTPRRFSASVVSVTVVSSASFFGAETVAGLSPDFVAGFPSPHATTPSDIAAAMIALGHWWRTDATSLPEIEQRRPIARSVRAIARARSASASRVAIRASIRRRFISSTKRYDTSPSL